MATRLNLHTILIGLLGSNNVYFQPPPDLTLTYPCIVYNRSNIRVKFADNFPWMLRNQYSVTVIDKNPDSLIPDKVSKLPGCIFDRHFATTGLNHDVFNLTY